MPTDRQTGRFSTLGLQTTQDSIRLHELPEATSFYYSNVKSKYVLEEEFTFSSSAIYRYI